MAKGDLGDTWMWDRAREMLDQADRLHRQVFQPAPPGQRVPSWVPPADVFETPTEVWVVVALPGVAPDSIELRFEGQLVVVAGERAMPASCRGAQIRRLEIPHGRFERQIALPAPCAEVRVQELVAGCLMVGLVKRT